jgi:hypothetical protein
MHTKAAQFNGDTTSAFDNLAIDKVHTETRREPNENDQILRSQSNFRVRPDISLNKSRESVDILVPRAR